jgi:NitT/TauT family transport system substrate-binding protein
MAMRPSWPKRFAVIALLMLCGALVAACGGDDDDGDADEPAGGTVEVNIGTQPWIGYGPFWIAEDQGFDEDHGVDIQLVNFSGRQELESGFASGKFVGANSATNDLLRLADLGVDFRIVLMEDVSLQADGIVSCNPDIRSIEELEGATVAFEEFSVSDVLFRYALDEAGISFDTIEHVPAPPDAAGASVAAGRVDVATTYEPYLQAAVQEGENCEVIYTAAERPGLISDSLAVNTEFAEENPEAIAGVLQAWGDAVDFYNRNTEEAQTIIAENLGEKPEDLATTFDGVELYDLEQSQDYLEDEYSTLWEDVGSILVEQGQIDALPNVEDYLDPSHGEQALGEE